MISLSRRTTSRKLGTALLSCSRQALPRPARLYSTPSRPVHAPALATATAPPAEDYSIHVQNERTTRNAGKNASDGSSISQGVHDFLRRRMAYTILPAPMPSDTSSSPLNDMIFPGSPVQESLTIIDACLHDAHDVRRAQYIFDQLRERSEGRAVLNTRIYNLFMQAFLDMALHREPDKYGMWMERSWNLYNGMESGWEAASPNSGTYALMLKTWLMRQKLKSPSKIPSERSPVEMVRAINARQVDPMHIVADRAFSGDESAEIIQELCRAAADIGSHHIISALGQAQTLADPLKDVPEVMPVKVSRHADLPTSFGIPQETLEGLAEAGTKAEVTEETPFNIANLRKHLAEVAYAQRVLPDDMSARQKLLEASVYDLAVERLRHEAEKLEEVGVGDQRKLMSAQLQKWMFEWHGKLTKRLAAEIAEMVRQEYEISARKLKNQMDKEAMIGAHLSLLPPAKLSLITILELMRLQGTGGVSEGMKTARALLTVGKAIELEYKAEILKKNNIQVPTMPGRPADTEMFTMSAYDRLTHWRRNASEFFEGNKEWAADWTHATRARVGSFLVDCLMDAAHVLRTTIDKRTGEEVSETQPAFYHCYEYMRGHKLGVIRLNPVVADRLQKDDIRATLHPRHLPMLVKPKAWISHEEGGYIYNQNSVMRLKDTQEQLVYLRHASQEGHMEHIYAGLDVLGSTPWIINRDVFNIVLEVWNSGERFVKIPEAIYAEPEPHKPEDYETNPEMRTRYNMACRRWQISKANSHSKRCSVNYKVEIARAFLADTMYFPHSIDFRGRAYPIPPHLNHIGDDLSRGLLKFAEKRPLGATGLRWLKIHLANLYGFDKGSFEERVQFVQDHLEDIYDSAEKPLEGRRWWVQADDPWQCLATCMELRNALESGDPEAFESNLPVHQDGTCNGLQHYAALGGDAMGARQVNLDIADRPSDVYSYVAAMVDKKIEEDALKGEKYAAILKGKISRKVVKQTVMTTVYGVTYIGAREQIEKQLKAKEDIEPHDTWPASLYLAKIVMSSIGDLFRGAKAIQTWLTTCARLISKSIPKERIDGAIEEYNKKTNSTKRAVPFKRIPKEQMTSVVWTTPLGLPIVQPYRKIKRRQIMTSIQTVFISDPNAPSEVNAAKQASAFPPNFIHSLDATHMMLTALECNRRGITFASVHDSYWTHAGSIQNMNEIIRDTFIALHESDVLERLKQEFTDRYKDYQIPLVTLKHSVALKHIGKTPDELSELAAQEALKESGSRTVTAEEKKEILKSVQAELAEADQVELEEEEPIEATLGALPFEPDDVEEADLPVAGSKDNASKSRKRSKSTTKKASEEVVEDEKPKTKTADKKSKRTSEEIKAERDLTKEERKKKKAAQEETMVSRFVNVADLLPPLPKKGEFDVKKIRDSKYFFS